MLWKMRLIYVYVNISRESQYFSHLYAYACIFTTCLIFSKISSAFNVQVNILKDSDWIVHLDEETILTEGSVKGILNFISEGKHQFGQGVITYVNDGVTIKLRIEKRWVILKTSLDSWIRL